MNALSWSNLAWSFPTLQFLYQLSKFHTQHPQLHHETRSASVQSSLMYCGESGALTAEYHLYSQSAWFMGQTLSWGSESVLRFTITHRRSDTREAKERSIRWTRRHCVECAKLEVCIATCFSSGTNLCMIYICYNIIRRAQVPTESKLWNERYDMLSV
jgi:hypothetical protein